MRPLGYILIFLALFLMLAMTYVNCKRAEKLKSKSKKSGGGARSTALRLPTDAWSAEVFALIEWRRFEAVCELFFNQTGFATKSQTHGADGGVDIWLYCGSTNSAQAIVQCKHWKTQAVGVKEIREFFGVMTAEKVKQGIFATSSTFTQDAKAFANANGITIMDGANLLKQIRIRSKSQQNQLLKVAFEAEYWRPTCASCGIKMVEREGSQNHFWSCINYPKCKLKIWKSRR